MKEREKAIVVGEIIDNIRRVFQAVNEYSKKAERETGLTGPQLWAIKVIAERGPLKVSELARRMYLHPATVVGVVDRLEGRGLVSRMRSREDRRVVKIELTEHGKNLIVNAPEVAQGLLVRGLETLEHEQLLRMSVDLERLVEILGAQEVPPKLLLSSEINLPGRSVPK
ncbi:Transcriptional regulator, MarR family [Citrifermentans bremense]|uniref:Transcriptional regulator, MarR family n=1 Tax=Citrifermentans bremense TaxID=60035 RepID=A0A6S6M5B1_9BACT|nr:MULTISPECIES: MarR family transcriptional regulator [Geobacteraceae]BCG46575.1 Transcriptional regulator, MarR family [Citrifermentans bremense]